MSRGRTGRLWQRIGLWAAVGLSVVVGVVPILAPRAPSGGNDGEFSIDRAVEHVEFIAREPHVMGTPEIARVREYVVGSLVEAGLEPETMTIEAPDYFGGSIGTVDVVDVLARVSGASSDDAILLMAHYDTVPTTSGANDNSAAVAALLEVARILASGPAPPHDVIFLFTDGEEPTPRFGAWGFAEYHPWFHDVSLAVNFEGISVAGPTILVEVSGPRGESVSRLVDAVPKPAVYSFLTQTADLIGGAATDFDVFRDRDVPGYNFTYMRGTSIYHTARDSIANLNIHGLAHHGSLALGIAQNFEVSAVGDSDSGEAVFFTVPFDLVVRYSTTGAMVSLIAVLLLVSGALRIRLTRGGSSVRALVSGLGGVVLAAVTSVVVLTIVWVGFVNLRPEMGLVEGYVYLAALVGLTGGTWHLVKRRSVRRGSDTSGGIVVVWLVLALLVGWPLPAIGYLFVWPVISVGIGQFVIMTSRGYVAQLVAVTIVALTTAIVVVPAVDIFFHFASPRPGNPGSEMPVAIIAPLLLVFLAIGLISALVPEPSEPLSGR